MILRCGVFPLVAARYDSDLTDAQWRLIEPLLPRPAVAGRREKHPRREIVNAILYVVRTGCAWRLLPRAYPPWQTVFWYFKRWRAEGTLDRLHDALRDRLRDADGRDPMVSAAIVDAQSVKGADTVGRISRGYDAGKKVNGRKRHVVVDTLGLLLVVVVTAASVQDRDGGARVLERLRFAMPSAAVVWADGGYAGRLVAYARQVLRVTVDIVRKREGQRTFEVLPRRWVVERTLSWISLSASGARLRAAPGTLRGHGQVGDDRADDAPAGARTRAATMERQPALVIVSQTPTKT